MEKSYPLFIAVLKSGRQYYGGLDYYNPKWKEINEEIDKVFFKLPDNNFLIMSNYEKYLYLIEGTIDLNGERRGQLRVENLYFMGLRNNVVDSYRVTIFARENNRYKMGDITKRQYKWGEIKNKYKGWH